MSNTDKIESMLNMDDSVTKQHYMRWDKGEKDTYKAKAFEVSLVTGNKK